MNPITASRLIEPKFPTRSLRPHTLVMFGNIRLTFVYKAINFYYTCYSPAARILCHNKFTQFILQNYGDYYRTTYMLLSIYRVLVAMFNQNFPHRVYIHRVAFRRKVNAVGYITFSDQSTLIMGVLGPHYSWACSIQFAEPVSDM